MRSTISFILDGRITDLDLKNSKTFSPTSTILNFLRSLPTHKGVKEGCAEGDCGACTVVLAELVGNKLTYRAVDSCLMFLPMIHGKQLITVENLKTLDGKLHPVQQAMVDAYGSQCGFCTPGIIMTMFALYKNHQHPTREQIDNALTGNLCRCTGYRPIVEAAEKSCVHNRVDHFTDDEQQIVELLKSISKESIHVQAGEQKYFRPASLGEAISLKHQHSEAIIINGATDIALRVTKNHELLKEIIDLSGIEELKVITKTDSSIEISAGVSLNDILSPIEKDFQALHEILKVFGSHQIRNLATLGGNLGSASPIGDTLPVLMAYDANVVVESLNSRRMLPLHEYITGYRKTVRKPDEIITSIIIPKLTNGSIVKSYKVSKRKDLDISTLSACFKIGLDGNIVKSVILAYGGMAERTKRASIVEQFLLGKEWERKTLEQAMQLIEKDFTPISDARGSAEFRLKAAQNLLLKFFIETKGTN
ncbi:MAG: xanthine dehydrogenase small subunit [Ignavibacteriales bacterium]|nr:xanthine dehydrogenase small subunit [Ignavibacteriales bacterium]